MAAVAPVALSTIAQVISALYGVATEVVPAAAGAAIALNDYFNKHIEELKRHENTTISRSGRVLEAAKIGFGLGYTTSVAVIATGQIILGNPLAATATVGKAAVLSNPAAATCAAIGAIVYGYYALSDVERQELHEKVSSGLDVGVELIKSIVTFVITSVRKLLSDENIAELKEFVSRAAKRFGRKLSDITNSVTDTLADGLDKVREDAGAALDAVSDTIDVFKESTSEAIDKVVDTVQDLRRDMKKGHVKSALKGANKKRRSRQQPTLLIRPKTPS